MPGSLQAVLQAAIGEGLSFDPLSFCENDVAPPEIGIRRGQIADALVVATVVVVVDELSSRLWSAVWGPRQPYSQGFSATVALVCG